LTDTEITTVSDIDHMVEKITIALQNAIDKQKKRLTIILVKSNHGGTMTSSNPLLKKETAQENGCFWQNHLLPLHATNIGKPHSEKKC
jgi:hypothetical protein